MIIIGVSEARQKLTKLIDEIDTRFERVTITKGGRAKAVLMSADEFESWMETVEEYNDPETLKRVRELNKLKPSQIIKSKEFITLDGLRKKLGMRDINENKCNS